MPRLIRFMLSQFANGAVLGRAVGLAILWADIGQLQRLLSTSGNETGLTRFSSRRRRCCSAPSE